MNQSRKTAKAFLAMLLVVIIGFIVTLSVIISNQDGDIKSLNSPKVLVNLEGAGTKLNPYIIANHDDLIYFRNLVNKGNSFKNTYFQQSENINLKGKEWTPIGNEKYPFYGIYDGKGHYVENLRISSTSKKANNAFFGVLGGVVVNFGVESGKISGRGSASIASKSVGDRAALINCYSNADLVGKDAGGIAHAFMQNGNVIACCRFNGTIQKGKNGILTYGGETKLYHNYTTFGSVSKGKDVTTTTSNKVKDKLYRSEKFIKYLNLSVAFTQCLYANYHDVDLIQWEMESDGNIVASTDRTYIDILEFINLYLLPLILVVIIICYAIAFAKAGKENIWQKYKKDISAICIISGIVSLFVNTAAISKIFSCLNLGNTSFIILINGIFFATLVLILKNGNLKGMFKFRKEWIPLTVAIIGVSALAFTQFDVVPKFDAGIYYGSLVQSVDLFQIDLMTYIGAFVCWKWAQGLVLLIAPLEFLFTGQAFGVYISNLIIIIVTMICVYWLLRSIGPKITPLMATFGSLILVLCPYQLGLFSYLCMDTHTAYFLIWTICSYKKKNNFMIAFCGYLLAFNKITGLVFYVFFLMAAGVYEMFQAEGKNIFKKIASWWNWKKVICWVLPAVIYFASTIVAEDMTVLNFYGSYTEATIGLKEIRGLANNFMQAFIYGFRWIFVIAFVVGIIALLLNKNRLKEILTGEGLKILISAMVACMGVFAVLCLYRGDAECPRYTAMFNVFYALSFPFLIQLIADKKLWQHLLCGGMTLLLLVQLFITIDPMLIFTSESINSGKREIYKLALPGDKRPGMTLGKDFGHEVYGDLYTYNFEHNLYDDLLDQALTAIEPKEDTQIVLLDVIYYETHLVGNRYRIYWNTRTKNRTYDGSDPDSIFFKNSEYTTTKQIKNGNYILQKSFHLLVPSRVDPTEALKAIKKRGYEMTAELEPENIYGSMKVYSFKLDSKSKGKK